MKVSGRMLTDKERAKVVEDLIYHKCEPLQPDNARLKEMNERLINENIKCLADVLKLNKIVDWLISGYVTYPVICPHEAIDSNHPLFTECPFGHDINSANKKDCTECWTKAAEQAVSNA